MARVNPPNLPENFQRGVRLLDDSDANNMNIFANLVAAAINLSDDEIQENKRQVEVGKAFATVTGTANAIILTTPTTENFDLTIDGNPVTFIPVNANTGAATVAIDGDSPIAIQKPNGSGGVTALEGDELQPGIPVTLYRRESGDFFLLAPSGGAIIKSVQVISGSFNRALTTNQTYNLSNNVTPQNCIIYVDLLTTGAPTSRGVYPSGITESTVSIKKDWASSGLTTARIIVVEYENAKSRWVASVAVGSTAGDVNLGLGGGVNVDVNKAILAGHLDSNNTGNTPVKITPYLSNQNTVTTHVWALGNTRVHVQVLELT